MFSNWKHIIPVSFQNTPALDVLITEKNNRQTWFCFKFSITFPHHAPPISVYFLQPQPLLLPLQPPKGKKRVHEAVASTSPRTSTSNSNMFGSKPRTTTTVTCMCMLSPLYGMARTKVGANGFFRTIFPPCFMPWAWLLPFLLPLYQRVPVCLRSHWAAV